MGESQNKIVLFAKKSGLTSFSSLYTIKHAFNTKKVGHTGTLDSFACGLLVVCTGSLTRLAGRITEFDKTYQAIIKFGEETDTLERTGSVVRTAPLPEKEDFFKAFNTFNGVLMQRPPAFSAIHVDGKRASDLMRSGKSLEIPERKITVYSSKIIDLKLDQASRVVYAHVELSVSKGTYIRSLARDIAAACGSAGHLAALMRTSVGNFKLEDAAGYSKLEDFNIQNTIALCDRDNKLSPEEEALLEKECLEKALSMTSDFAKFCGFGILVLKNEKTVLFDNGAKLHSDMFTTSPFDIKESCAAVFTEEGTFKGCLEKNESGYFGYAFVIH